ncbi:MAG: flippase-like domain-containing protein [Deltaproteobacteria bacterium]|nr:flippase-like domain-containing protein [Deltaproteobacteria bacterium]
MRIFHRVCILSGTLLFVWLLWRIGPNTVWRHVLELGWGILGVFFLEGAAELFHTLGWRSCLAKTHRKLGFGKLFAIKWAGYAINNLTPTANVGGEVTKGTLLAGYGSGAQAASGVIVGKMAFVLAQLLFVAVGSVILFPYLDVAPAILTGVFIGGGLLLSGLVSFLLLQKYGKLGAVLRRLAARNLGRNTLKRFSEKLDSLDNELRSFYIERPFGLYVALLWHSFGFVCYVAQVYLFLILSGAQATITGAAGAWCLASWFDLAGFAVPLRIGVQEGARVVALVALGLPSALGMAFAMVIRIQEICWAGLGLLVYASMTSKNIGSLDSAEEATNRAR